MDYGEWLPKEQTSSMFPKNWNEERIMEEVAVAWKNMEFVSKRIENGVLVETYAGKATTGMEIELIFNDGILKTTTPKVK